MTAHLGKAQELARELVAHLDAAVSQGYRNAVAEAQRPSGMALIRAARVLDVTVNEYREMADTRPDEARSLYAENCAEVAEWLRKLVPGV